jgi:hypothetical protein
MDRGGGTCSEWIQSRNNRYVQTVDFAVLLKLLEWRAMVNGKDVLGENKPPREKAGKAR